MDWSVYWRGLVMGFSIAAPVGPIGVLCIRRTLAEGRAHGLVSGLGAATADAFYGAIAALGLTVISNVLVAQQFWLRLVGGAFLLYLGVRTLLSRPAERPAQVSAAGGLLGSYVSTLFLTLTNPMTILSFMAVFAGLWPEGAEHSYAAGLVLVFGVFCGSALWWFLLSGGVSLFRTRLGNTALLWVNRISGSVILGFALWLLVQLCLPA